MSPRTPSESIADGFRLDNSPAMSGGNTTEAEAEPFYTVYADMIKGPWRITVAVGFSDRYEFRSRDTNDSIERDDYQIMVQYTFEDNLSLGAGVHRIKNRW
ncbi:MAG: hypothetical protein GKR87_04005 [Kiritimatiellae bacterium]|nr:hypothetical protein [Kiritimatiellia bacterium]